MSDSVYDDFDPRRHLHDQTKLAVRSGFGDEEEILEDIEQRARSARRSRATG